MTEAAEPPTEPPEKQAATVDIVNIADHQMYMLSTKPIPEDIW
ncbi:unnamed protein product [Gongylonema pulchrum]|uniref:WW domain-containing protein n=1 Tax=Gongylonema pulchrum TaxID=637853 RepID=A0A183EZC7_9BILA|nr:unnamed protein product [Gongylonema pulchrum]